MCPLYPVFLLCGRRVFCHETLASPDQRSYYVLPPPCTTFCLGLSIIICVCFVLIMFWQGEEAHAVQPTLRERCYRCGRKDPGPQLERRQGLRRTPVRACGANGA